MKPIVRIEYEIKIKDGPVLESSHERGPLELVMGERRLLPRLEQLIARLAVGEEAAGVLAAPEAFGDEALSPTRDIPRGEFPPDEPLQPGRIFEAHTAGGEPVRFRVEKVADQCVTVRFLHPLAEKDLEYRMKVLAIVDRNPPPPPASALGIDSAAICIDEERAEA